MLNKVSIKDTFSIIVKLLVGLFFRMCRMSGEKGISSYAIIHAFVRFFCIHELANKQFHIEVEYICKGILCII